jgi:23S rRNA (adenine2503-C2)-methyltransferase
MSTLTLEQSHESQDGSKKLLWRLHDQNTIESVLLPRELKARKNIPQWIGHVDAHSDRTTACISSQVGCAMGCQFCSTAQQKLTRHLSAEEIVDQVRQMSALKNVTNIVFMGMGEPLHNLANLIPALRTLRYSQEFQFSRRKILVSTSGFVPGILELAESEPVRLAVSLNATDDVLRSKIMPINRRYPIAVLLDAARAYSKASRMKVVLEYVLLKGLNDTEEDSMRLLELASGWPAQVNLIPYNAFPGSPFERPNPFSVKAFQHSLVSKGLTTTVRYSGGDDVLAACGQLKSASRADASIIQTD